jgi:hypothetical protein
MSEKPAGTTQKSLMLFSAQISSSPKKASKIAVSPISERKPKMPGILPCSDGNLVVRCSMVKFLQTHKSAIKHLVVVTHDVVAKDAP